MNSEKDIIQSLEQQIEELKKEKQSSEINEKLFLALVETAVGDIGQDFFDSIVIKLSEWLNAECIIIGQLVEDNIVEGFPMYLDGEIIHGFTYHLKNTPCDLTTKKGYCVYEDNLTELFPESKDVQDLKALGYVGTALYNKKGQANGVLCAMSRKKLNLPQQAEGIIKIVGARITSEIERKKTQKKLEQSEKELRISNAAKDRFFSILAHDLRTPFNSLIGFSELLKMKVKKGNLDDIKEFSQLIFNASNQTYSLLNNLLEWSLSHTNGLKYNPEEIQLNKLLNLVIKYFNTIAQNKKITIKSDVEDSIVLFADKNMINTILRNLISNALKYTPTGGLVSISATKNEDALQISVSDTGIGMKSNSLNKLFKIEESMSTNGLNNEKGTGLGLILCKDFIDIHKGKIWAESEVEKGSTFNFTIPNN